MTTEEKEEIKQIFSEVLKREEELIVSRFSCKAKETLGGYVLSKIYVVALAIATWAYFALSNK
jgi:predicted PurR-regulated permease PerM